MRVDQFFSREDKNAADGIGLNDISLIEMTAGGSKATAAESISLYDVSIIEMISRNGLQFALMLLVVVVVIVYVMKLQK